MKRSNDQQHSPQDAVDSNKKPRYNQAAAYGDMYAQYSLYGAAPYTQATPNAAYAGYTQPAAPMYYGTPQTMMATPYGASYPQQFVSPTGYPANPMMPGTEATRTIYLGNVIAGTNPHDILSQVHCGLVDNLRFVPEKTCAFLTFVDPSAAQVFYQEFMTRKLLVNNIELKLGWGKASPLSNMLKLQIQSGATRNVYLGRLDENDTDETIRIALSQFGPIECIKLIRDKNIGFVHFLSISSAVKCVTSLPSDPAWQGKKVNYGKDHCADDGHKALGFQTPYANFAFDPYQMQSLSTMTANVQRTLYLGNIHPEATCEDICNAIRGGSLLNIRYLADKHIAFVTFMDATIALSVFNHISTASVHVKGRKLRVGWGKSSNVPSQVAIAVQNGATRNVYLGGVENNYTVEKLRQDFSEFGEIELVNINKEKNCAFVNFTNVQNAMNAIAGIKQKPDYQNVRINYGKDRCGNPWKVSSSAPKVKKPTEEIKKETEELVIAELTEANLRAFNERQAK